MLAYKHATTGPQLSATPPVIRIAGDVKLPQNPPVITTVDATAIQMAAKYGWGNPPWFQIPKWVFSGIDQTMRIDTFALACVNVNRDIRGLCAGDLNGSYLPPNGYKMAEPSLELVNKGTLPITPEITFPVRAERDMELGAITLMLDYDPTLIEITGVTMPEDGGVEPWFDASIEVETGLKPVSARPVSTNGVLRIGWASLDPINVPENGTVLLIHARLTNAFRISNLKSEIRNLKSEIRFTLNISPLSELADGNGNVIDGAKLTMPDASSLPIAHRSLLIVYPNPACETLNLELETTSDGPVNLELVNLQGLSIMKRDLGIVDAGWHMERLDLRGLTPGVYFLRANLNGEITVRKVIISR
jgi:hypothetical protein